MEKRLWRIIEKLRGAVDVRDYKRVVLPLFFLRYADFVFERRLLEISKMKHFSGEILPEFFFDADSGSGGGVFLPEDARWDYILGCATGGVSNLAARIDRAFRVIVETNPSLSDVFDDGVFSSLNLEPRNLSKLVLEIDKAFSDESDLDADVFGTVYQYLLRRFSAKESRGKGKGEFYTPPEVVKLIFREIVTEIQDSEPWESGVSGSKAEKSYTSIYDPCAGTGSMLLSAISKGDLSSGLSAEGTEFFGQEINPETYRFLKLNFAIRGLKFDFRCADALASDEFSERKFDFVLANPPFNQRTSFSKNANFSWLFHCLSHLADDGFAAVILPGTVLSSSEFLEERRELVESGVLWEVLNLPRNAFYGTETFASVLFLRKNRDPDFIKFVDIRSDEVRWTEVWGKEEILRRDFSIAPSDYIEFSREGSILDEADFKAEISGRIREKEAEIRKLRGLLDFSSDFSELSGVPLSEIVEEVSREEPEIFPGEFGVCLLHVGRDLKLPIVFNASDAAMAVPKNYLKFRVREEFSRKVPAEYLVLALSRREVAERLAFSSDKSARGEVSKEEFLKVGV